MPALLRLVFTYVCSQSLGLPFMCITHIKRWLPVAMLKCYYVILTTTINMKMCNNLNVTSTAFLKKIPQLQIPGKEWLSLSTGSKSDLRSKVRGGIQEEQNSGLISQLTFVLNHENIGSCYLIAKLKNQSSHKTEFIIVSPDQVGRVFWVSLKV